MRPVHPGEILRDELQALGVSANALSKALAVPVNRVTAILHGQRGVNPRDTAACPKALTESPWAHAARPSGGT